MSSLTHHVLGYERLRQTMNDGAIKVEEIMQRIREQIIARKMAESPDGKAIVKLVGKHLPPDFYEHLYHAGLMYNQIDVQIYLSPTPIPLIGPLLQRLRQMVHEVVVFYVNGLAAQQMEINKHLLRTVSLLGEEMEKLQEAGEVRE
jgi:hypothetical protein